MSKVYIVSAHREYESCNVIAAFQSEADAKAFSDRCKASDAKKPQCPSLGDDEGRWSRYYAANQRWEDRHPAKGSYGATDYPVQSIRLRPKSTIVD